jgi:hypothetical protein
MLIQQNWLQATCKRDSADRASRLVSGIAQVDAVATFRNLRLWIRVIVLAPVGWMQDMVILEIGSRQALCLHVCE